LIGDLTTTKQIGWDKDHVMRWTRWIVKLLLESEISILEHHLRIKIAHQMYNSSMNTVEDAEKGPIF
jgi:hypothetical protein